MRFLRFSLAVVLLAVVVSAANAFEGIGGEYAPNVYTNAPNAIGDIKGEFVPNLDDDRPNAYYGGLTPSWLDALDYLLGY